MLIVMEKTATDEQIEKVVQAIKARGYRARPIPGRVADRLVAAASGSGTGRANPASERVASTRYDRFME